MTQVAQLFHLIALPLYLGVRHCGLFISHLMNMAVQEGIIFCEGKGVWGGEGCGEWKGVGRGRGERRATPGPYVSHQEIERQSYHP